MAARKPKNPFNDLADLVKSQMYGSKPTTVSTQKKIKDVGTLVKTVDTFATGGLGRAVVADSKAQARGANVPVNLATYGVTSLAAGAVGAVVAKGAVRAVQSGRVVNPVAAVRNITSGQRVVLHGSPQKGLSVLKPATDSHTLSPQNVLFSWNPRRANMSNEIHMKAIRYANKENATGSIYVAKVPKKATGPHPKTKVSDSKNMLVTSGEGKIVAEIPVGKPFSQLNQAERKKLSENVQAELRKAGVQPRGVPQVVDKTLDKVDDVLMKAEYKTRKVRQKLRTPAQKKAARRKLIR